MNTRSRTAGLIVAAAAATALIAGCSNNDSGSGHSIDSMSVSAGATPSASTAAHNAADVAWVQMMIPHHQQAVQMAALADGRTQNAALLALAGQIKAAQDPEIEQMTGWLGGWGAPTMASGMDHSSQGMGGDMGGMMSADQMSQLEKATGADFDRAWLEMMIAHHQGAIDSSKQIQADGQSAQVRELAGKIVAGQQAEIDQMKAMLGQ